MPVLKKPNICKATCIYGQRDRDDRYERGQHVSVSGNQDISLEDTDAVTCFFVQF